MEYKLVSARAVFTNSSKAVKARRLADTNAKRISGAQRAGSGNRSMESQSHGFQSFEVNRLTGEVTLLKELDYEQYMQVINFSQGNVIK